MTETSVTVMQPIDVLRPMQSLANISEARERIIVG